MAKSTGEKKCTKCGILKGPEKFYQRNSGLYLTSHCRSCIIDDRKLHVDLEYRNIYYYKNRVKIQGQRKVLREGDMETKIKHILRNSKQHSLRKGVEFSVDYDFVSKLYEFQNHKCALSGEDLEISGDRYLSNMISLDRKDSSLGYTKDNVQWVCVKYNMMKAHSKLKDFIEMCRRVVEYNK